MTFEWVSPVCLRGHHDRCGAPEKCDCDCHDPDAAIEEEPDPEPDPEPEVLGDGRRKALAPKIEVVFAPLPPMRRTTKPLAERMLGAVEELRARPGEWAKVAEYTSRAGSGAQQARKLLIDVYPDIEWTCRRLDPQGSALWGRARP